MLVAANLQEGELEELLHISEPRVIDGTDFSMENKQLNVYVKFRKEALFPCTKCGELEQRLWDIADYDRKWRHLNFFEYPCYIHEELPRSKGH